MGAMWVYAQTSVCKILENVSCFTFHKLLCRLKIILIVIILIVIIKINFIKKIKKLLFTKQ